MEFIFRIICLLLFIYQFYKLSSIYFSYKTTTNVVYELEKIVSFPAITICFDKFALVKNDSEYSLTNNETINDEKRFNFNNQTIREQIQHIMGVNKILDCYFAEKNNIYKMEKCDTITDIRLSISGILGCFHIFSQLNGESDKKFIANNNSINSNVLIALRIKYKKLNNSENIYISIHNRKERIYSLFQYDFKPIKVNFMEENKIHFRKIKINQKYNRFVKSGDELQTRYECIYKCKIDNIIKMTNSYPFIYFTYNLNRSLKFNVKKIYTKLDLPKLDHYSGEVFSDICGIYCDSMIETNQEFYLFQVQKLGTFAMDYHPIFIEFPTEPVTIYEIYPKMYFEEYLCFVASLLSLWFGFSFVNCYKYFILMYKTLKIYKSKNMTTNKLVLIKLRLTNRHQN